MKESGKINVEKLSLANVVLIILLNFTFQRLIISLIESKVSITVTINKL